MGRLDCAAGVAKSGAQIIEVNCGVEERNGKGETIGEWELSSFMAGSLDCARDDGGYWGRSQIFCPIGNGDFAAARELTELEHGDAASRIVRKFAQSFISN